MQTQYQWSCLYIIVQHQFLSATHACWSSWLAEHEVSFAIPSWDSDSLYFVQHSQTIIPSSKKDDCLEEGSITLSVTFSVYTKSGLQRIQGKYILIYPAQCSNIPLTSTQPQTPFNSYLPIINRSHIILEPSNKASNHTRMSFQSLVTARFGKCGPAMRSFSTCHLWNHPRTNGRFLKSGARVPTTRGLVVMLASWTVTRSAWELLWYGSQAVPFRRLIVKIQHHILTSFAQKTFSKAYMYIEVAGYGLESLGNCLVTFREAGSSIILFFNSLSTV